MTENLNLSQNIILKNVKKNLLFYKENFLRIQNISIDLIFKELNKENILKDIFKDVKGKEVKKKEELNIINEVKEDSYHDTNSLNNLNLIEFNKNLDTKININNSNELKRKKKLKNFSLNSKFIRTLPVKKNESKNNKLKKKKKKALSKIIKVDNIDKTNKIVKLKSKKMKSKKNLSINNIQKLNFIKFNFKKKSKNFSILNNSNIEKISPNISSFLNFSYKI